MRDYGFSLEEMPFDPEGYLPSSIDPKQAWAKENLVHHPIEINQANRQELLRIPGIGPQSANAILSARRQNLFRTVDDLRRVGINPTRALPYILLAGCQPDFQISMF
jgi:predicted DNA-binding helix-hairpin-helix protein